MLHTTSVSTKPILQEIFEYKQKEVAQRKKEIPLATIQEKVLTSS